MTATAGWSSRPAIERASPSDRAFLAMDAVEVPEHFGVILMLAGSGGFELARVRRLIAERVPAVPRLRQRLVRVPFGCGGPIWVDDPGFDIRRHVRAVTCPEPADEQALLDTDAPAIAPEARFPRPAPGRTMLAREALASRLGGLRHAGQ